MDAEVIVVGSGFSGTAAAYVLSRAGISVLTLDKADAYPDAFRAEKLEPNQVEALRGFGLLEYRQPLAGRIGKTISYRGGVRSEFDTQNQYGIRYGDTVNNFRKALKSKASIVRAHVTDLKLTNDVQTVVAGDKEYTCRLVILAAGGRDALLKKVGIHRRCEPTLNSFSLAFDIEREDGVPFSFNGFNYFLEEPCAGVDYVTLFNIGGTMRVNLFTQWLISSPKIKEFKLSPVESMGHYFPDLKSEIGNYKVTSRIQFFPTSYYRLTNTDKPGIVVIGDDFQSVSPTTGSGLDKVTTDVDRLCNVYIPEWLRSPGMGDEKIKQFYGDHVKKATDNMSLGRWISYRDVHRNFFGRQVSKFEVKFKKIFGLW